jgi:hypothetical protein
MMEGGASDGDLCCSVTSSSLGKERKRRSKSTDLLLSSLSLMYSMYYIISRHKIGETKWHNNLKKYW